MDSKSEKRNPDVVDALRLVLDLLGGPRNDGALLARVDEVHSTTAQGLPVEPWDEHAMRWSITGGLSRVTMPKIPWTAFPQAAAGMSMLGIRDQVLFETAWRYVYDAAMLHGRSLTPNGFNNSGWPAVRDLLELAVLLAEHDGTVMATLALPSDIVASAELREKLEGIMRANGIQFSRGNEKPS